MANEFGVGHGHVASLAKLGSALVAHVPACKITYCVPNPEAALRVGIEAGTIIHFNVEQLGSQQEAAGGGTLHGIGPFLAGKFAAAPQSFSRRLTFWTDLIARERIDIAVAEYAPTLLMAARGKAPALALGNGYTLPPPEAAAFYSPVGKGQSDPAAEQMLAEKLNVLLHQAGTRRISALPRMFKADAYALMTIPLFDPHWEVREQDYLGLDRASVAPRPAGHYSGALAYFSMRHTAQKAAQLMRHLDVPVDAYMAGASAEELGIGDCSHIRVRGTLFNFAEEMPGKAVIIHGGTLGTTAAAMYAGVPQVALYHFDEHQANAYAARRAGICKAMSIWTVKPDKFAAAVHDAAVSQQMRDYAREMSDRYQSYTKSDPYALAAARAIGLQRI